MTTEPPHIASPREQTFILIPAFGFDSERNARKYLYSMKGNREYTDFVFHQRGGVQSWYVTRPWAKEEPAARRFLHTDILSEARRGLPFQSAVLWRKKAGSLPEGSFHTCLVVSGKREIKKARPEDIGQYAYMEWMCDDSRTKNSASIVLSKRIFAWRYGRGALYSRHTQTSASGAITGTVTRLLLLAFQIFDQDRSRDRDDGRCKCDAGPEAVQFVCAMAEDDGDGNMQKAAHEKDDTRPHALDLYATAPVIRDDVADQGEVLSPPEDGDGDHRRREAADRAPRKELPPLLPRRRHDERRQQQERHHFQRDRDGQACSTEEEELSPVRFPRKEEREHDEQVVTREENFRPHEPQRDDGTHGQE